MFLFIWQDNLEDGSYYGNGSAVVVASGLKQARALLKKDAEVNSKAAKSASQKVPNLVIDLATATPDVLAVISGSD